ncbi:TorD/DmsD family molecular chaperone [Haloarchaeobius sp. DYHT-AS-18]|uniref:TorD/DmsD family molecular chaperone n=1 Tax=Haloarchaeobius sp. DYHT-AS-18 TaxID=3446117 RepID=UPI003EBB6134
MEDTPEFHARRAALYGFAATVFQHPDESVVSDLLDEEVHAAIGDAGFALDLVDETTALLAALEDVEPDALEPAYNALFGLPGDEGTYPVVPYEAHYTTGEEVNESQRRIGTVVGILEEFGLGVSDDFHERQDHVAVELELMQVAAAQRSVALERSRRESVDRLERATATILDEHLTRFVPAFAHRVRDATESIDAAAVEVYVAGADLAAALVQQDVASHPEPPAPGTGVNADD